MHACTHLCMYVYAGVCTCVCMYVCMCVCMWMRVYVRVNACDGFVYAGQFRHRTRNCLVGYHCTTSWTARVSDGVPPWVTCTPYEKSYSGTTAPSLTTSAAKYLVSNRMPVHCKQICPLAGPSIHRPSRKVCAREVVPRSLHSGESPAPHQSGCGQKLTGMGLVEIWACTLPA